MLLKKNLTFILIYLAVAFPAFAFEAKTKTGKGIKSSIKRMESSIAKEWTKVDIKLKVPIKLDFFDKGLGLEMRYRYEVEPSYRKSFYSRFDEYLIKMKVNGKNLVGKLDSKLNAGLNTALLVRYIRQFETQGAAFKAPFYRAKNFPSDAYSVINNLNVHDFVEIRTNMSFFLGLGFPFLTKALLTRIYANTIMSGEFLIHIYKLSKHKITLRFITINKKSDSIGLNSGFDFKVDVFGSKILNRALKKALFRRIETNLIDLSSTNFDDNIFVWSYTLDLKHPEVRAAYNKTFKGAFSLDRYKDINPLGNTREHIKNKVLTDLTPIDDIFKNEEKQNICISNRRIERSYMVGDLSPGNLTKFNWGINALRYKNEKRFRENNYTIYNKDNTMSYFLYPTYTQHYGRKFFFGYDNSVTIADAYIIAKKNKKGQVVSLDDFGINYNRIEKELSSKELNFEYKHMAALLPKSEMDKVDWKNWKTLGVKNIRNARIEMNYNFNSLAFATFVRSMKMDPKNYGVYKNAKLVENKLREFFHLYPPDIDKIDTSSYVFEEDCEELNWQCLFKDDIRALSFKLTETLVGQKVRPKKTFKDDDDWFNYIEPKYLFDHKFSINKERLDTFTELRNFELFNKTGMYFLKWLLKGRDLKKYFYFKTTWQAANRDTVTHAFSNNSNSVLIKNLKEITQIINNRSFDLRDSGTSHQEDAPNCKERKTPFYRVDAFENIVKEPGYFLDLLNFNDGYEGADEDYPEESYID